MNPLPPRSPFSRPAVTTVVGVTLVLAVFGAWAVGAGAQTRTLDETRAERREVQDRQDRLASELDVLSASEEDIEAALDELDEALAAQQSVVDAAVAAASAAASALAAAEEDLAGAEHDVAALQAAIREMAIAAFMQPPTADLIQSLKATSFSDALLQKAYLDARAARDVDLLDLLELAEARALEVASQLAVAAEEAESTSSEAAAELAALEQERRSHDRFAAELRDRIDAALAEAAVLADLDSDLAADIARAQAELLARIPPPPPPAPPAPPPTSPASSPSTPATPPASAPGSGSGSGSGAGSDRTVAVPPLATVGGITVHADLADDLAALLAAASADGIQLAGSGYRSTQRQIELRTAHCGPTDYDIWEKPAGACSPPTAIPGRSLHEQGRAIDFTHQGMLITSRSNPAFVWMAANAAAFGLFNLPSEPWHWSTTGY